MDKKIKPTARESLFSELGQYVGQKLQLETFEKALSEQLAAVVSARLKAEDKILVTHAKIEETQND